MSMKLLSITLIILAQMRIGAVRLESEGPSEDDDQFPCGVPAVEPNLPSEEAVRIINGWEANPHSVPWQVRVVSNLLPKVRAMCGGSLIQLTDGNGTDLVLTAAHCVHSALIQSFVDASVVEVTVGAHDLYAYELHRQTIKAKSMLGHPDEHSFKPSSIDNDFIVIRLRQVVPYTEHTRPVCLPKHQEPLPFNKTCYVSGWGTTSVNRSDWPHILMQASAIILPYELCYNDINNKTMLCAGLLGQEMSACFGDSGGALVCKSPSNAWVQYGIVSWGRKCASPEHPVVYTHVSYFARYISLIGRFLQQIS